MKSPKRRSTQEISRRREVERENNILLQKMMSILGKPTNPKAIPEVQTQGPLSFEQIEQLYDFYTEPATDQSRISEARRGGSLNIATRK